MAGGAQCILGLDPGLSDLGYGLVRKSGNSLRHLAHGSIRTKADQPLELRLQTIFVELQALIQTWSPQIAGIESLFFTKNISSALPVAHARGVIMLCCAMAGLSVREFSPPQIKQAVVGSGRADKHQVQEMVKLILGLSEIPKPDHAADALAAAICLAHMSPLASPGGLIR